MRASLCLLLVALPLAAAEPAAEASSPPPAAAVVGVSVDTLDCPSGVYERIADDTLRCTAVDRMQILTAQRDFHEAAQRLYQTQVEVLRLERLMTEMQARAAERCRLQGKTFDQVLVRCGEALKGGPTR